MLKYHCFKFLVLLSISVVLLSSCGKLDLSKLRPAPPANPQRIVSIQLEQVDINENNLILQGLHLEQVKAITLDETTFSIDSKSEEEVTATPNENISFENGSFLDLIITTSYGSESYRIAFSVPNGSITGEHLSKMQASDGDVLKWDESLDKWVASSDNSGVGTVTSILRGSGLVNSGTSLTTSGTIAVDIGTTANKVVALDGTGKLPAVDGSQLTGLPGGDITEIIAGSGLTGGATSGSVTLNVDIGTTANKVIALDGTGKLPAVDGSQLTGLPGGDITEIIAGSGLTGGGSSGSVTLNVDTGTTANKIVQLDVDGKLPALNGSLLTNLTGIPGRGGGGQEIPSEGSCPTGYVAVPGDVIYDTSDFCVMKYEAKNSAKGVVSVPGGIPLRGTISYGVAIAMCRNLGPGFALINNAEWMTIASNIAQQGENWSSGSLGTGCLYGGHNDNDPATLLSADSDDDNGWYGTNDSSTDSFECPFNTTIGGADGKEQRRTFVLSNGSVIWDFSGNLWEWVDYFAFEGKVGAVGSYQEMSLYVADASGMKLDILRPLHSVQSWWDDSWNSNQGCGQYYAGANNVGGAALRSGGYNRGLSTGIFTLSLLCAPSYAAADVGFRCVYRPGPGGL